MTTRDFEVNQRGRELDNNIYTVHAVVAKIFKIFLKWIMNMNHDVSNYEKENILVDDVTLYLNTSYSIQGFVMFLVNWINIEEVNLFIEKSEVHERPIVRCLCTDNLMIKELGWK